VTGSREESPHQVRESMLLEGSTISSRINGCVMQVGCLETPTLAERRAMADVTSESGTSLTFDEVVGDSARARHIQKNFRWR